MSNIDKYWNGDKVRVKSTGMVGVVAGAAEPGLSYKIEFGFGVQTGVYHESELEEA